MTTTDILDAACAAAGTASGILASMGMDERVVCLAALALVARGLALFGRGYWTT